jgi:hypothetical protein
MSIQDYLTAHPEILTQFDAEPNAQNYGLAAYTLDRMKGNGTPEERAWASMQGQKELDAATQADGNLNALNQTLRAGIERAGAGGNTNQVQGGYQTGTFNTNGTTNQTGVTGQSTNQTGVQNSVNTAVNNQNTTGNQSGVTAQNTTGGSTGTNYADTNTSNNTTGTARTTGTAVTDLNQNTHTSGTRTVNDSLGFGKMLKDYAGTATGLDNTRNAVLTDVATTGGKQFGSQLTAGINNSLSGPGMVGVGTGAQSRVAGAAAADIGRNNLAQRLQATEQLAGPSATTTLAAAGNPYLGETTDQNATTTGRNTTTSDNTTTSNQNTTGTSNMTGGSSNIFNQSMLGSSNMNTTGNTNGTQASTGLTSSANTANSLGFANNNTTENNSGTSNASSAQVATGQIPEGKQTSGGGCMVCSFYASMGQMNPGAIRRGVDYKLRNFKKYRRNVEGYMLYGPFIAKLIRRSRIAAIALRGPARSVLAEECRLANPTRHPFRISAFILHKIFVWTSNVASVLGAACGHSGRVEDVEVENVLKQNNLWRNF